MKTSLLLAGTAALALTLAACGGPDNEPPIDPLPTPETSETAAETPAMETTETLDPMEVALAGDWRSEESKARDDWRNPAETLAFLGVEPDDTVVEIWPGGGWYTEILAPMLKDNGTYIAANFDPAANDFTKNAVENFRNKYMDKPETFGDVQLTVFSAGDAKIAPDGSADAVLTFRNVHNWMSSGFAEEAFADMYAALKPGGTLGVIEHRLPSSMEQDPQAISGYVHEDLVRQLASEAGFEFVEASEINANPADTADHPFGVWTLPPTLRSAERGQEPDPAFDTAKYEAIGESDRMTLKFRKPEA